MSRRIHTLDRRELLRWIAHTSAGVAGLSLLGGCGDDPSLDPDGSIDPGSDTGTSACPPTSSDVLGPYYRAGAPSRMTIASATEPGERLWLDGVVTGPDCAPLAGVVLDIWQADRDGVYYEPNAGEPYRLRGKLASAADGTWQLDTIRPGNYMLGANSWRPAHLHNDGCTSCGSDDPARIIRLLAGSTRSTGELSIALARA